MKNKLEPPTKDKTQHEEEEDEESDVGPYDNFEYSDEFADELALRMQDKKPVKP